MPIAHEHDLHNRRRSRNLGLLAVLVGFVTVIFAITVVKLSSGQMIEGFDHTIRPSLMEPTE